MKELAALFALKLLGEQALVMPKFPFSPFNFSFIDFWGTKRVLAEAAAGAAIAETIYEVKPFKFALLLSATILTQKTTGTAMSLHILRKTEGPAIPRTTLISETSSNGLRYTWPPAKTPAADTTIAWHMCFMYEGDKLTLTHALTAAETITDDVSFQIIEYSDPRYEKK